VLVLEIDRLLNSEELLSTYPALEQATPELVAQVAL
jgi:hypothetical protein